MSILKILPLVPLALLTGYAAANATDAVVVPADAEPVEYVRICDAYGSGYYYIPGTDTCMRIHGYVRAQIKVGDNINTKRRGNLNRDTYDWYARATLRFSTASETDLGTLRSYFEVRSHWVNGANTASGQLRIAFIQLGGLRVGLDDAIFASWTGYGGKVIDDGILDDGSAQRTNGISYTFNASNGFSAIIGLEQGAGTDETGYRYNRHYDTIANTYLATRSSRIIGKQINDYAPHVTGGLKFTQGWGTLSAVAGYDARNKEWAGKVRLDLNVTDQFSVWAMAGYKSMEDYYRPDFVRGDYTYVYRVTNSNIGAWGGDWVVWSGGSYKFNKQTSFNYQLGYEADRTLQVTANVSHQIVPGLTITPELSYVKWNSNQGYSARYDAAGALVSSGVRSGLKGQDALQGIIRLQRSF